MAGTLTARTGAKLRLLGAWFKPAPEKPRPPLVAHLLEGEELRVCTEIAWQNLTDLGADSSAEKRELRVAGVSERRIQSLYPHEFEDLVVAIIRMLGAERPRQLDDGAMIRITSPAAEFGTPSLMLSNHFGEWQSFASQEGAKRLRKHFDALVLYSPEDPDQTSNMTYHLWQAHWLMTNLHQFSKPDEVSRYFLSVIEWLLPALLPEKISA